MPSIPKRQKRRGYMPKRAPRPHGNQAYRFYNSKSWRKCSCNYRRQHPMCEVFPQLPADVVDHIIPITADERGFPLPDGGAAYDANNLMAMSHKAHNTKRGKEAHGFQVASKTTAYGLVPIRRQDVIKAIKGE